MQPWKRGRAIRWLIPILLSSLVLSCAGTRYIRAWESEGVGSIDRLLFKGAAFRLERFSDEGVTVFTGRFEVRDDQWRFEIHTWKPTRGIERVLEPPVTYVCRGRLFANGLAFFSSTVVSGKALDVFIPIPFDFDLEE